ncbi:MCE family protein [Pseudonocardia kunmingensis]|uniref:Virulence factor Mce-like protein n=1 Tax=Pseudonocardia kunmingensis TaxID=630975 RepID=A0A543E1I1_9PSEU|nr:MCE family protein [Pseudonocardia kunmingensis]TQM15451.1 virulence factor Mce-like protein [Pseudonocardia kunmingensis]
MMKRRLQGLLFVVVLLALTGLAVGEYAGAFDEGVPVTLRVERVGNQLSERADVKVRGLNVGEVESVSTDGTGATVELSIDPEKVELIPANVSARLIPKTLFGERYVSLVLPDGAQAPPLAAGDVIPMDRSDAAREVERVLDGLLPLLTAVEPQDLATTLGALSQALAGRGEDLGETLVRLQELTGGLRPAIPDLQEDITQLADFAGNLDEAAPDLLDALEDFTVTSRTVVEQRAQLRELLTGLTGASDDLRAFLDANGENIISLADSGRPTLETLARYSPEFPCLLDQIAGLVPRLDEAFGAGTDRPGLRVTLEIVANQGKYVPNQDEPRYLDDRGPRCYPILELSPEQPPDGPFEDGTKPNDNPSVGTLYGSAEEFGTVPASYGGGPGAGTDMGVANSPAERQVVAELLAVQDGTSPEAVPAWSTMLVGPLYRGTEVKLT